MRQHQGRSQGGAVAPPIIWQSIFENVQIWIKRWLGGGGGEVKRDHTLRKLWIDHLHKAGNCSLEALEFSTFLGCYSPTAPPPLPPQNQESGYAPGQHARVNARKLRKNFMPVFNLKWQRMPVFRYNIHVSYVDLLLWSLAKHYHLYVSEQRQRLGRLGW